jgi:O-antigen ligase
MALLRLLPAGRVHFSGPFLNPNTLGAFIPLVAPVLLLRLYQSTKHEPIVRATYGGLTGLYAVCLVMSRSRTGMIATFVGCAWWLYFYSRKAFSWFVGAAIVGALILLVYFPRYAESLNQVYVQKGGSYILQSRAQLLDQSWEAAKENPAFGSGFGVTKGLSEDWRFGFESGFASREKMNSLLALVEEVGLVGAIFLLYPIAWVLAASARRLKLVHTIYGPEREYWTVLTLSACMVAGLADSMGEAWLTGVGFFDCVMFWLLFGVLSARLTMPLRARQ